MFARFEVELAGHFSPDPPLYLREKVYQGLIKFSSITLDYYWKMLGLMNEVYTPPEPFEININFYANFLNNNPCTSALQIRNEQEKGIITWSEEVIPLLTTCIADQAFLEKKALVLILTVNELEKPGNEIVIGGFYSYS